MREGYLTAEDLSGLIPLSAKHIADRVVHREDFPKPYRFGGTKRFWREDEVKEWIASRKEGFHEPSLDQ